MLVCLGLSQFSHWKSHGWEVPSSWANCDGWYPSWKASIRDQTMPHEQPSYVATVAVTGFYKLSLIPLWQLSLEITLLSKFLMVPPKLIWPSAAISVSMSSSSILASCLILLINVKGQLLWDVLASLVGGPALGSHLDFHRQRKKKKRERDNFHNSK